MPRRKRASRRTCDEPGCDRPYHAKGLCGPHYNAARKRPSNGVSTLVIPAGLAERCSEVLVARAAEGAAGVEATVGAAMLAESAQPASGRTTGRLSSRYS